MIGQVLIHGATGRLRLYRIEPLAAGTSAISAAVNLVRKYGYGDKGNNIVARIAKLKVNRYTCYSREKYLGVMTVKV